MIVKSLLASVLMVSALGVYAMTPPDASPEPSPDSSLSPRIKRKYRRRKGDFYRDDKGNFVGKIMTVAAGIDCRKRGPYSETSLILVDSSAPSLSVRPSMSETAISLLKPEEHRTYSPYLPEADTWQTSEGFPFVYENRPSLEIRPPVQVRRRESPAIGRSASSDLQNSPRVSRSVSPRRFSYPIPSALAALMPGSLKPTEFIPREPSVPLASSSDSVSLSGSLAKITIPDCPSPSPRGLPPENQEVPLEWSEWDFEAMFNYMQQQGVPFPTLPNS